MIAIALSDSNKEILREHLNADRLKSYLLAQNIASDIVDIFCYYYKLSIHPYLGLSNGINNKFPLQNNLSKIFLHAKFHIFTKIQSIRCNQKELFKKSFATVSNSEDNTDTWDLIIQNFIHFANPQHIFCLLCRLGLKDDTGETELSNSKIIRSDFMQIYEKNFYKPLLTTLQPVSIMQRVQSITYRTAGGLFNVLNGIF